eukprot:Phypoly_transcript_17470.p1 GENE.Phypoly_transcript_17470~~Phypoly_transcript_17470.p1  ORF type:complete len:224 (+),score=34.94 Phypoly_transcript_17470:84-755(+)
MQLLGVFVSACLLVLCVAQDPAEGWLAYAEGTYPGATRITSLEAKWVVPDNPKRKGAFFSPWFGIESSDNLNLIQPVNPWSGDGWQIYNEYFQWKPTHNQNSKAINVKAGDVVYGQVTYNPNTNAYDMYHSVLATGESVNMSVPIQKDDNGQYKVFTIMYFVFEKVWACDMYPPNNQVTFYDIVAQYDGQTVAPKWNTSYVDDACNNRAQILNETAIQITWNS